MGQNGVETPDFVHDGAAQLTAFPLHGGWHNMTHPLHKITAQAALGPEARHVPEHRHTPLRHEPQDDRNEDASRQPEYGPRFGRTAPGLFCKTPDQDKRSDFKQRCQTGEQYGQCQLSLVRHCRPPEDVHGVLHVPCLRWHHRTFA